MSPRELVILILGLAIVALVLRGLFVALKGRRGQIRLAIDKNIPRDVDLNALEMAELPSGGARVVARSFAEVNRQNQVVAKASANATALDLGKRTEKTAPIPVLMDPVNLQVRAPRQPAATPPPVADLSNAPVEETAELADDVLFDYDERRPAVDNLSQVTPDYAGDDDDYEDDNDDEFEDDDIEDDDFENDEDAGTDPEFDDDELDEADADESDFDDAQSDDDEEDDEEDEEFSEDDDDDFDEDDYDPLDEEDAEELDADLKYADDELDEFSMTAGERIGVRAGQAKPTGQSSLFGEDEIAAAKPDQSRRNALFAAFSRKTAAVDAPKPVVTTMPAQSPPQPQPPPISVNVAPKPQIATRPQVIPNQQVISAKPKQSRIAPVQESNQVKQVKDVVAEPAHERATAEPSEVIVINVMAKAGRAFVGDDLLHVLITSGMKFGDMNIFHRRLGGDNKSPVIFSIANILNPGTFDLNKMHDFSTPGVSLFLALPTSIKNLDAFDQMLNVARQLCGALEGELRDDSRNLMTAQTIEHYRQRIRDFELRRLKAVGTRG